MKQFKTDVMWKGMAMGVAEIIPGVSGGTIAFITGIYEKLLATIMAVDLVMLRRLARGRFREAFAPLDGGFIASLGLGMVAGIIGGVLVISHLIRHWPEPLWGFFFGLIVASALLVGRELRLTRLANLALLLVGFGVAFGITRLAPGEANTSYPFVFVSAIIAISAMLLPGISGSFMLLLMGMYGFILGSVKSILTSFDAASLLVMVVFCSGLVVGAATFARLFSWLFARFREPTLAILTGFLVGSLAKLWPWRNVDAIFNKESDRLEVVADAAAWQALPADGFKIMTEQLVWPAGYWGDPKTAFAIAAMLLGFGAVLVMDWLPRRRAPQASA